MTEARDGNWRLSVVAPVYNEEKNIRPFLAEVIETLICLSPPGGYEVVLVNDGSRDGSAEVLDECAQEHGDVVTVIHLARNFGMESAIFAGLEHADGDAVIILDSDMQDDPGAFETFAEKWRAGYDVVYAVRTSRQESFLRRGLFRVFYRLLQWLANIEIPLDASNFGLMDRCVVDAIVTMQERNRFFRGLRAWVGFRQVGVPVARRARRAHGTRLGLRGQWRLAMNAIFAFSYVPLFVFRLAGAFTLLFCAGLIGWVLYAKLFVGLDMKAWASQMIATSFIGGINLLGIGVLGEYVARMHDEVKGRPNYIVHRVTGHGKDGQQR